MWDKVFIGTVTAFAFSACGQSTDGQAVGDLGDEAPIVLAGADKQSSSEMKGTHPIYRQGQLPDTLPPAAVAAIQEKVTADLKAGLSPAYFDSVENPDDAIFAMGGNGAIARWDMNVDRYVLHLVARHIEKVADKNVVPDGFCETGDIYSALVAARPYLREEFHSTAMRETTVRPYGLLICEGDDGIKYQLASADSGIFKIK